MPNFKVTRLKNNPIIYPEMDDSLDRNINGPSLIRVPEWIKNPLGRYYLYFASHKGSYIYLAYSDNIEGPWQIFKNGTLQLEESLFPTKPSIQVPNYAKGAVKHGSDETKPHIASPDVHVYHETKEIRMYYHGLQRDGSQMTRIALSKDGIHFKAEPQIISYSYLRVFRFDDYYYGMCMPGIFYRSLNGLDNFERGPILFNRNMRHSALRVYKNKLQVFWTQVRDSPERILLSTIDLSNDWLKWKASPPIEIFRPETEWEGAKLPIEPSFRGPINEPVCQLRDPAIFEENDKTFLLYSIAGESGIAIAELIGL
ncbi:MAG: hypothetical protein ACFE94_08705 [Candidatus Hodarchaeota archaeon]